MRKLLFIFMSVLTFSMFSCSNRSAQSSTKVSVDSDSIVNDTVDTLTTAQYDSIMANC